MPKYIDYTEYYDSDHAYTEDIPLFLEYAKQTGSSILELACRTGRVMIPLAEAGYRVWRVDFSENMLAVARKKIAERGLESRISVTQANMADFDLPEKDFALAFVRVRSFMYLFTQEDQIVCLSCAIRHLRPGGFCSKTGRPSSRTHRLGLGRQRASSCLTKME